MKIIQIERKAYKVTKKVYETLRKLDDEFDYINWPNEELEKLCNEIEEGKCKGARLLGDIEFYYSYLPF